MKHPRPNPPFPIQDAEPGPGHGTGIQVPSTVSADPGGMERGRSRFLPFLVVAALAVLGPAALAAEDPYSVPGSGHELEQYLPEGFHRLQLGDPAPDFSLIGVDDKVHSLREFAGYRFLLVVFLSNHCPFSHAAETRMLPWINRMREKGLGVVAIQPNHPDALSIDELGYSKYSDSFPEMKLYASEHRFTFPYLYDGETQNVAKTYGALATPDLFLFDESRHLRYSGRFDDSRFEDPSTVTRHDAENALDDLLAGRAVAVPYARPMGCAVKWRTKIHKAAASNAAAWDHVPITIEPITASQVAALAANPTGKLRLINVWATWCGPCVSEFPELAKLSRRLKRRDFEVVTISIDAPKDQDKVLRFLERQHAGMPERIRKTLAGEHRTTNNYIYSESSTEALVQALDPKWPGPIPYSVLVAPGGRILWRQSGAFDPVILGRTILDQLGGFYPQE